MYQQNKYKINLKGYYFTLTSGGVVSNSEVISIPETFDTVFSESEDDEDIYKKNQNDQNINIYKICYKYN